MLHIVTIVIDGMPWITWHLPMLQRLDFEWRWHVVEGIASHAQSTWNVPDTEPARLSMDGTAAYLDSLRRHQRVRLYRQRMWPSKLAMVNAPLGDVRAGDIVMQVDADELWSAEHLAGIIALFAKHPECNSAAFRCRYYLGMDLVVLTQTGYGNRDKAEWRRAWRAEQPGFRFKHHNAPVTNLPQEVYIDQETTKRAGLVFEHYAYATEAQVWFKERYYGYRDATAQWRALQQNQTWPHDAADFLAWVPRGTIVGKRYADSISE